MKKSLRQTALALRHQLSANAIKVGEESILASVHTLLYSRAPCTVGLFYPTRGEPNLLKICTFPSLASCAWSLPVCVDAAHGSVLQFAQYTQATPLCAGRYNIPVPAEPQWVQPSVVLIPCVAFHRGGARLGYGAGWYDKTLARLGNAVVTVGIALAQTEIMEPFAEPHDRLLDYIVTEREMIKVQPDLK